MNTLDLIFANNGVLESTAALDEEDSIGITTLSLSSAADTTSIGLHATVEGSTDFLDLLVGDTALGGGDWDIGAANQSSSDFSHGTIGERTGSNRGHEDRDGSGDGELHVGDWMS